MELISNVAYVLFKSFSQIYWIESAGKLAG